jgi:benzylsuccinate CoA-transferase BbsF subunit
MPERLLAGIKVADFSRVIVGPLSAKTLCDYGAEVVKIEGRSRLGHYRTTGPEPDLSAHFTSWNTGKLSIAINLAVPQGVELAKKIVAWSDVVVESFAGGSMRRMGLGYDELRKVKPDIIMLSSCMQGQTGPFASHPGWGFQLSALSGFCHITGWPDRPSPELGVYTDFVAPHFNVCAMVAALLYRRRTGKGLYIDMSQFENAVQFMSPSILDYSVNHRTAGRVGNKCSYAAPHGAYRCRGDDRWCAIAVFTDQEWQDFCRVTGNPSWTADPRFVTLLARKENEEELDRLVTAWTASHSAEEVMQMVQAAGVPAGVLETGEDLLEKDPQIKHRQMFREVDHPRMGKHHPPGSPFLMSRSADEIRRAPLLGEHNEYVLKQILGMSDDEIADLVMAGAVE